MTEPPEGRVFERMARWEKPRDLIRSFFGRTDEQLMWRVKTKGDQEAFAGLVARWERPVLSLCTKMTGDTMAAEDITQTTFARVFANRERWECTGRFSTWLWRIAINLCHDEGRKPWRRNECSLEILMDDVPSLTPALPEKEPAPDAQAMAAEQGELIRSALDRLHPRYREVIVLKHYEGMKFQEIAGVLGIPVGTVKSRMAEGLDRLQKLLKGLDVSCNQRRRQVNLREQ